MSLQHFGELFHFLLKIAMLIAQGGQLQQHYFGFPNIFEFFRFHLDFFQFLLICSILLVLILLALKIPAAQFYCRSTIMPMKISALNGPIAQYVTPIL